MDTVGGFKLVRRLGSGTRADVYLGHPIGSTDDSLRTAAIKVFHSTTPTESIDDEISALARASSPFLLSLRDLSIGDDGRPVLVLGRIGPMTCSRLILERQRLSVGEAVTILAPLADAVDELDAVGVMHGRIRVDRIAFDEIGTPVLFGFGHARVVGRASSDDGVEAAGHPPVDLLDDTHALAAVARSVLEATRASASRADLLDFVAAPFDDPDRFRADLRDRLFDLADPEPVVLTPGRRTQSAAGGQTVAADAAADEAGRGRRTVDWIAAMHLPDWIRDLVPASDPAEGASVIRRGAAAVRGFLAPVRRPVWIAAGSTAVLLIAALLITGTGGAGQERAEAVDRSTVDTGVADADVSRSQPPDGVPDPWEADGHVVDTASITGDDPALAATALLTARAECMASLSILCLDAIDQQGSAALEADSALIRALQEGGGEPVDFTHAVPTVAENLGGSVILSLALPPPADGTAVPVSMLIVRGEDGWRIRDLIVG